MGVSISQTAVPIKASQFTPHPVQSMDGSTRNQVITAVALLCLSGIITTSLFYPYCPAFRVWYTVFPGTVIVTYVGIKALSEGFIAWKKEVSENTSNLISSVNPTKYTLTEEKIRAVVGIIFILISIFTLTALLMRNVPVTSNCIILGKGLVSCALITTAAATFFSSFGKSKEKKAIEILRQEITSRTGEFIEKVEKLQQRQAERNNQVIEDIVSQKELGTMPPEEADRLVGIVNEYFALGQKILSHFKGETLRFSNPMTYMEEDQGQFQLTEQEIRDASKRREELVAEWKRIPREYPQKISIQQLKEIIQTHIAYEREIVSSWRVGLDCNEDELIVSLRKDRFLNLQGFYEHLLLFKKIQEQNALLGIETSLQRIGEALSYTEQEMECSEETIVELDAQLEQIGIELSQYAQVILTTYIPQQDKS